MSYKKLLKDIKGDTLPNLVMIYGAENLLIRWCVSEIIKAYVDEGFRDNNVWDLDGVNTSVDEVISMALTPSMFPGRRIIIVRNLPMLYKKTAKDVIDTDGAKLLDFAGRHDLDAHLILMLDAEHSDSITAYGKKVIKAAASYNCERLDMPGLRGFIGKRVKSGGKTISNRDIDHIVDLTGYTNRDSEYTLDELHNSVIKLVNAADGMEITRDLIDSLMIKEADLFVFNFIDALVKKNRGRAMELVIGILGKEETNPMQLIALLVSQFELMYDALELSSKGMSVKEIAKTTGSNEYRLKLAGRAASSFGLPRIKELLTKLYNMDKLIKTGDMRDDLALETFVLGI